MYGWAPLLLCLFRVFGQIDNYIAFISHRYNITPDGDLVIRDVSYTDVGTYQCYAKNKFGEKSAFGSLDVKSKCSM